MVNGWNTEQPYHSKHHTNQQQLESGVHQPFAFGDAVFATPTQEENTLGRDGGLAGPIVDNFRMVFRYLQKHNWPPLHTQTEFLTLLFRNSFDSMVQHSNSQHECN